MCGMGITKLRDAFRRPKSKSTPKAQSQPQPQPQHPPQHRPQAQPGTRQGTQPRPQSRIKSPDRVEPKAQFQPQPSDSNTIRELAEGIEKAYRKNNDTAEFLPYDKIAAFTAPATVASVLRGARIDGARELEEFVLARAKRLFLILVMIAEDDNKKLSLLSDLKRSGIIDKSLPIVIEGNGTGGPCTWSSLEVNTEEKHELLGNWSRSDRNLFETYQWCFLAPRFGKDTFRFKFHPRRTLPYLQASPRPASSGFFGEVSRVEIHKAHLDVASLPASDSNTEEVAIAIKKAKHDETLADYFDKEASNLHRLQLYKSPHLITPIAAYQKGDDRCLIFPWANGGNLLRYWSGFENQRLELDSLRWVFSQVKGICSALQELHEENTRHGDLKPENILWFQDENNHGIFQIADLGLAAFHEKEEHTKNRKGMMMTFTPSGTSRYEPPEMDDTRETHDARSRQYDVWSMGCVLLELLIWLIYGYESVEKFKGSTTHFWEKHDKPDGKKYIIHPYVEACMAIMMEDLDGESITPSAYKDLLSLVRDRLLVIEVSEIYESSPAHRETAETLHKVITNILDDSMSHESYLCPVTLEYPAHKISSQQRRNKVYEEAGGLAAPQRDDIPKFSPSFTTHDNLSEVPGDNDGPKVLVRAPTGEFNSNSLSTNASINSRHQEHSSHLNDDWDSKPDNEFATQFINSVGWNKIKPKKLPDTLLCKRCSSVDSTRLFEDECNVADLKLTSNSCDLCNLLDKALEDAGIRPPRTVTLSQDGATISVKDGPRLLSVYVTPDLNRPDGTQLGLPEPLKTASDEQLSLLRTWIETCDSSHEACIRKDEGLSTMPTRLIEIGTPIKLIDSANIEPSHYVALSHCWGSLPESSRFCTFKRNIAEHRTSIEFERLPLTFRDAISVVRSLGFKYIWIDSLCIIQDDEVDWGNEAAKMEQVFSSAHFTIAASSAKSSDEGFLSSHRSRPCVQLSTPSMGKLYVCPNIDNFHKDVELGELNRRGWVLQERVLSRRTIYFSSNQLYWECGAGVRCETLACLHNSKAAFLGDSNFPDSALEYYRDGRQVLVQDLYERYSGLAFTNLSDRSVAILGLQKRLERAFQTHAAFGLFSVYFGRGLLWQRRGVKLMKRIAWPQGRHVPSWSWISKEGPIKYMKLEFEKIDWATKEFRNPFKRKAAVSFENEPSTKQDRDLSTLKGQARKLHLTKLDMLVRISFDTEEEFDVENLRCVVIGRDKADSNTDDPKQHVLVVHPLGTLEEGIYERVGVASLRSAHIGDEGQWVTIR